MYLFKTSGSTFNNVIRHQKHAFVNKPRDWFKGELVLVSKNKIDLGQKEKQISYLMELFNIRTLRLGEANQLWPNHANRWKYLVECTSTRPIMLPFNLDEVIGVNGQKYAPVQTFIKIKPDDEKTIMDFLRMTKSL